MQVVVEGRLSQELNLAGEKTPEPLLVAAVRAAADRALPGGAAGLKVSGTLGASPAGEREHVVAEAGAVRA